MVPFVGKEAVLESFMFSDIFLNTMSGCIGTLTLGSFSELFMAS